MTRGLWASTGDCGDGVTQRWQATRRMRYQYDHCVDIQSLMAAGGRFTAYLGDICNAVALVVGSDLLEMVVKRTEV